MGSIGEARSNQRIGWCCIDRLNRHGKPVRFAAPKTLIAPAQRQIPPQDATIAEVTARKGLDSCGKSCSAPGVGRPNGPGPS